MPYILVLDAQQSVYELTDRFVIGRDNSCNLPLPYKKVSRNHAAIFQESGLWYIEDLNSTNGTFVNGQKIETVLLLNDKDEIEIGNITLVFSKNEPKFENDPFVTQISTADESVRSKQHSGNAERFRILLELSTYLNSINKLNKLLQIFLESTLKLLKADRGFVMLKNNANQFDVVVQKFMKTQLKNKTYSKTACLKVIKNKRYVLSGSTATDDLFAQQNSIVVNNISSILVVPILIKEEVIGLIYMDNINGERGFGEEDAEFAMAIASHAAISIYNVRLYESLLREKNLVNNILSSMGDGLIVLNHDFQILKVNEVAKKIVLHFNQLPFFVREIKSLNYQDSIID